jgi:hypothetical protein
MTAGEPVQWAGGVVRVLLPPGQALEQREGVARWSPDPDAGAFTIVSGSPDDGGADQLLAAERASAQDVEVECDEETVRGGIPVRHTRYRTRRHTPRVVLADAAQGARHVGDEDVSSCNEFLFVADGDRLVRVGYSVVADAPAAVREALTSVFDGVRIGGER